MSWIQTYTGRAFDLLDPQPDMVVIEDIAHALSNICRFTGHTRVFYSVADHSCHVAEILPDELRLQGLLHDAAEAYIQDIATPLKWLLPDYKLIEQRVWKAIAAKFNLPEVLDPQVKSADLCMLMTERRDLLSAPPHPWDPFFEAICPVPWHIIPISGHHGRHAFLRMYDRCSSNVGAA